MLDTILVPALIAQGATILLFIYGYCGIYRLFTVDEVESDPEETDVSKEQ